MATAESIIGRLAELGFELATEPTITENQLRLTGRVHKPRIPTWMLAIEHLCAGAAATQRWNVDISQHHFVLAPMLELIKSGAEPVNGSHVRFAWRIILQAPKIADHFAEIESALSMVKPPQQEMMQVTLTAPRDRNRLTRGKGATPLGYNEQSGPRR